MSKAVAHSSISILQQAVEELRLPPPPKRLARRRMPRRRELFHPASPRGMWKANTAVTGALDDWTFQNPSDKAALSRRTLKPGGHAEGLCERDSPDWPGECGETAPLCRARASQSTPRLCDAWRASELAPARNQLSGGPPACRLAESPDSAAKAPDTRGFSADNLWRTGHFFTEYSGTYFLEQLVPESISPSCGHPIPPADDPLSQTQGPRFTEKTACPNLTVGRCCVAALTSFSSTLPRRVRTDPQFIGCLARALSAQVAQTSKSAVDHLPQSVFPVPDRPGTGAGHKLPPRPRTRCRRLGRTAGASVKPPARQLSDALRNVTSQKS
jgi:hypothetical protein